MTEWLWIPIGLAGAVWFFSIIEGWSDIGPIDEEQEEDP